MNYKGKIDKIETTGIKMKSPPNYKGVIYPKVVSLRVCLITQLSGENENFKHLFVFSAFDNAPLNWKSSQKITENIKWKNSTEKNHWM